MFALLGPSGCGKTSFLRVLAGFDAPEAGIITYKGRDLNRDGAYRVPAEKRGIGFVFQDYALFPHLTVAENVAFGIRRDPDCASDVAYLLDAVGLHGLGQRYPHELSGGQQQRVAIARTLAPRPSLVLLDEPFSNLDARLRQSTRSEIRSILKRFGITAIMVTHDQEEALSFADRVAVMRDGHIQQVGKPEDIYYRPRTPFVAQFLGLTNLILGNASGTLATTTFGEIALNEEAQGQTWISMRPEHLTLLPSMDNKATPPSGTIVRREFKGHDITFTVRVGSTDVLVHTDNRCPGNVGDEVRIAALEPGIVLHDEPPAVCP
jgi:iron(III) transport system ATP-binding protein